MEDKIAHSILAQLLLNKKNGEDLLLLKAIPRELWQTHMMRYLSKADLANLRLVSRWFRKVLVWEQWIPFEDMERYVKACEKMQFSTTIYGVYFQKELSDPPHDLQRLPKTLHAICLENAFTDAESMNTHLHLLPSSLVQINLRSTLVNWQGFIELASPHFSSLKQIILPFSPWEDIVSEQYLEKLIELFPDVDLQFEGNISPLYWACYMGYTDMTKFIVSKKTPTTRKYLDQLSGEFGETPLYWACDQGQVTIAEMLLMHGANPNLPCYDGDSPLTIASYCGHHQIVSLLLRYGVDINFRDADMETPLEVARHQGHQQVVELLLEAASRQQRQSGNHH